MNFHERPIINSPYDYPSRHWELVEGRPTNHLIHSRRKVSFETPIPKPKKRRDRRPPEARQEELKLAGQKAQEDLTSRINDIRNYVDQWRELPQSQWQVTPETARLLHHWRNHTFSGVRPFFCQIEAVETAIWLAEVAPKRGAGGKSFLTYLKAANDLANPDLFRVALKLATGAGKTTVMAMLIAWQTINAVRRPGGKTFSKGFLIVSSISGFLFTFPSK